MLKVSTSTTVQKKYIHVFDLCLYYSLSQCIISYINDLKLSINAGHMRKSTKKRGKRKDRIKQGKSLTANHTVNVMERYHPWFCMKLYKYFFFWIKKQIKSTFSKSKQGYVCSRSFSSQQFPAFGLNTDQRNFVSLRIQSKSVKIRTRKTPNMDAFHEVYLC